MKRKMLLRAAALVLALLLLPAVMAFASEGAEGDAAGPAPAETQTPEPAEETGSAEEGSAEENSRETSEETTEEATGEEPAEEPAGEEEETAETPEECGEAEEDAAARLTELMAQEAADGELTLRGDARIDADMVLPEETVLIVEDGTLTLEAGCTLENRGCIRVTGGELVIGDGAALENRGFIEVSENGKLTVCGEASYTAAEGGVLSLNVCAENTEAAVTGLDTALYEYTMPAYSAGELLEALRANAYAFKTVCISDLSLLAELGAISMAGNTAISFVG